MLKQALQVLTANLHLTQELWGIFLSHCMLVLRSSNEQVSAVRCLACRSQPGLLCICLCAMLLLSERLPSCHAAEWRLRATPSQARASALKALDEGIMRALSPEAVAAARLAAGPSFFGPAGSSSPTRMGSKSQQVRGCSLPPRGTGGQHSSKSR
jgi:hypothetical protein